MPRETLAESPMQKHGLVKPKSIRTKLMLVLGLLMFSVFSLIVACLLGLSRYHDYTEAMRQGSFEFQKAHNLYRTALELKATKERIHRYNRGEMLTSGPLTDPLVDLTDLESGSYWYLLSSFDDQLKRHAADLQDRIANDSPMIWEGAQRSRLEDVRSAYDNLVQCSRVLPNEPSDFHSMIQRRQEALVDATQAHLDATRESIDSYSSLTRKKSRRSRNLAIVFSFAAMVLTILLGFTFTFHIVRPFRRLLRGARQVANGQHDHRIHLKTNDELDELAAVLNKMTSGFQSKMRELRSMNQNLDREVRERTTELIQNEQLASVGFLAAGVAHEINNPLAAIAWSAESLQARISEILMAKGESLIEEQGSDDSFQVNLQRIEDEAYRCKAITEKLLEFSRPGNAKRVETDLVSLVLDVVQIVSKVSDFRSIPITVDARGTVVVPVNPQEIRQVVLNLLTNALQSLGQNGTVDLQVSQSDETATIRVIDNGCGMSPEVQQNLFEPFFTQRKHGDGTGLGLSISRRIVMQHGGSLQAKSKGLGNGSTFELILPKDGPGTMHNTNSRQGSMNEQLKAA